MPFTSGKQAFLEILKQEGVEVMFGNPGTTELPLMDGLARETRIRYILALQEAVARAHRAVLGHVASGLAHEPDGRDRCRLPATGEEKRRCDGVRHVEPSLQAASGAVKKAAV